MASVILMDFAYFEDKGKKNQNQDGMDIAINM